MKTIPTCRSSARALSLLLLLAPQLLLHTAAASEDAFESLVAQWISLRTEIAEEARAWESERRHLRREQALLNAERLRLQAERDAFNKDSSNAEQRRAAEHSAYEALRAAHDALPPLLDRAEQDLRAWEQRLPPAFKPGSAPPAPASPSERAQRVIADYSRIEQLQSSIHLKREMLSLAPEAPRREMEVLYLGLSIGYAVSPDDQSAALGRPGPDGWTWTPRNELAPDIRQAIRIYQRDEAARLIELPVQLAAPAKVTP